MNEGKRIAEEWVDRLEGWDWFRLHALSQGPDLEEKVTGRSGTSYRVRAEAFWDMEEWGSDLYIQVRVYAERGWRRRLPYKATGAKPGEGLPEVRPSGDLGFEDVGPAENETVLERAREDVSAGRLWKARDRLTPALRRDPTDQGTLSLLGEVYFQMGDLPHAGRLWMLTERSGPEAEAAFAAFEERWGSAPGEKLKMVPFRAPVAGYPPLAQERIRALQADAEAAGIAWPPKPEPEEGSSVEGGWLDGAPSLALLALLGPGLWLLGVAALIYLIVRWLG